MPVVTSNSVGIEGNSAFLTQFTTSLSELGIIGAGCCEGIP